MMHHRKRLQIGGSNYRKFIEANGYFVDKTLFIKEIIDAAYEVILVPRPRRFGKSLNLSMLKYYFDIAEKDTAKLFESYKIWQAGDYYTSQQGKYPVIHLSLKAAKAATYKESTVFLKNILKEVHEQHRYLLDKKVLSPQEQVEFDNILSGKADLATCLFSLQKLSKFLCTYYNQKVYVLMDEYDAPIHAGFHYGYYDQIITLMKSLMGNTFKDNDYLQKGIITGILRIARESIFSDLNNPGIFTILRSAFGDKFGFTKEEVKDLLNYFDLGQEYEQVEAWYDGYTFGSTKNLYNPWSVINYVAQHKDGFTPFWVNTSSDDLIKNRIIEREAHEVRQSLEKLIAGDTIARSINENIVFSDFDEDKEILWSLLVFCGYLTLDSKTGRKDYALKIPNFEIKTLFQDIVIEWFNKELKVRQTTLKNMANSLTNNRIADFKKYFKQIIGDTFSYFDKGKDKQEEKDKDKKVSEIVYHAYVLGLLGILSDDYVIKSNRESGDGRYDILLLPRKTSQYGIVIEIKPLDKGVSEKRIEAELFHALKQITDNKYYKELVSHKVNNRIEMAMVFVGKEVWIEVN